MSDALLCVAGGFDTTRDAEHGYAEVCGLLDATRFVATSFEPHERVVVTASDRPGLLPERARLFVFPGHEQLRDVLSVGDLLARTAIDEVRDLSGLAPDADELIETQGFVRPTVEAGRVVLVVRPYDDGSADPERAGYIPFEQPNPTPCCAFH